MAKADGPTDPDTGKKLKPEGWVDPKEEIKKLLLPKSSTKTPAVVLLPLSNKKKEETKGARQFMWTHTGMRPWIGTDEDQWIAEKDYKALEKAAGEVALMYNLLYTQRDKLQKELEDAHETINKLMDDKWDLIP